MGSKEGFPTEIFSQKVPDVMLCPICHGVMRQAATIMCRGSHKACGTCCQNWMKQKATCPCCQQVLTEPHFNSDPFFNSLIQQLLVRCSRPPCEWQGKLEDLARHQTVECSQREVGCTHAGCTHRCPASTLLAHLDACEWKPVPCEKCHQTMARKEFQNVNKTFLSLTQAHLATTSCRGGTLRGLPSVSRCPPALPHPGMRRQGPMGVGLVGGWQVARCRMDEHIVTAALQHVVCLSRTLIQTMDQSNTTQQRLQAEVAALKRQVDALMLARAFPDSVPNTPPEWLTHLRRTTRVLSGGDAAKNCDFYAFDLQARVPIRIVGLALEPRHNDKTIAVTCRPASCSAAPLADGWGALLGEQPPPLREKLVPIRFREPVTLAAGESVTFRCANVGYRDQLSPGNEAIVLPHGVGYDSGYTNRYEPRGFAGEIFYLL
ncbi:hypothetical protein PAPYR_1650 [Paratrimastix pyriformis]|uniref:Uncharacterized protein n=1 Tax=Paratrimastix pyriformis TaxID=342808 RepID=A0ABQ8US39_9EUKA|nr:hypothetical protein PAPYR_1650 [Paratrimastix pyriformis]